MPWAEFAGIGLSSTGGDWLELDPQPLFASTEVMRAFPASNLEPVCPEGGIVPAHRKLDHEAIRTRAAELRRESRDLKIGPAAASIIAELGDNPKTGKPWDNRGIERLIAHLWRGDESCPPA